MRDVAKWLERLGLARYAESFTENGVDLALLPEIDNEDLKDLGVERLADRKRILRAIAEGSAQGEDTRPVSSVAGAAPAEAERRQLTVMFCDLVGSTEMSGRLDPEDMREVLRRYQDGVTGVVTRHAGYVANYLGDGVLAFFGWPKAHEDQAAQAIRAGLEALKVVGVMRVIDASDEMLSARVGIATGEVVVGDLIGEDASQQGAVSGETPNLAARIQAIAQPGEVLIGGLVRQLLGDAFEFEDRGEHKLKGISDPIPTWRVLGERESLSRFDASRGRALGRLVGRERELGQLLECWRLAERGAGQVVLLSGEAGIGKSRISSALRDALAEQDLLRVRYQCSPHHTNSALHPIIEHLVHAAGFAPDDKDAEKRGKLASLVRRADDPPSDAELLFASLLSLPHEGATISGTPEQIRQRTLAALVGQLRALAVQRPLLLLFEDAHWADPTSLAFLELAATQLVEAPIMLVITHRPEWQSPLGIQTHVTEISLSRLNAHHGQEIVRTIASVDVDDAVVARIVSRTDGVPLFIEELTKSLLAEGQNLAEADIPATLQALLVARLDRLSPKAKEVAQTGSIIGREFRYEHIADAMLGNDPALGSALKELGEAEIVIVQGTPPNARYVFRHALVQDIAYQSLLRRKRCALHQRIARWLGDQAEVSVAQPELIAQHYEAAGEADQAVGYWLQAGHRANRQSANLEALAHLTRGLEAVGTLPPSAKRDADELNLLIALGPVQSATDGWAADSTKGTYQRATELCQQVDDPERSFMALWGTWLYKTAAGDTANASTLIDHMLDLARRENNPEWLMQAHHAGWGTMTWMGTSDAARDHVEQGLALYDPIAHRDHADRFGGHDPGVCGLVQGAMADWLSGYPSQARERAAEGVALSRRLGHQPSLAQALMFSAIVFQLRRELTQLERCLDELRTLATEHGITFHLVVAELLSAWLRAQSGNADAEIASFVTTLDRLGSTGVRVLMAYHRANLAEIYVAAGRLDDASATVDEAISTATESQELVWLPEILRLEGELALSTGAGAEMAGASFRRALKQAEDQGSKSFALRAATNLAQLHIDQNRRDEARAVLCPIFDWFTEGFDTLDLKNAKALVSALS
jgi:class 3 adenylate cyclase/tetratricopeptide (TPR) repeat protein